MKHKYNNIRLALTLAAALAGILAAQAGTEQAVRTYDTSALRSEGVTAEGVQYTRLSWDGLEMTASPGEPELPVEYVRFLVPVYTTNFTVSVSGVSHGSTLQTMYRIYPGQEPVTTNHEGPVPFTAPLESAYTLMLPVRAEVVSDGFVDGCNHIVTVAVYPTTYSPSNGTVMPASRLTVTLNYDDCTAADLKDTPIFPPHRSRHINVGDMVVNAQRMSSRQYAPAAAPLDTMSDRYYIITPRSLAASFRDLAAWKRQKGYDVVIKPIEEVYEDYMYGEGEGEDIPRESLTDINEKHTYVRAYPERLRTYLQDEFKKHGMFFCLIAGDYHINMAIPKVEYTKNGESYFDAPHPHDNGPNIAPADQYFANLTAYLPLSHQYNLTIEIVMGGISETEWSIPVGRLLCSTPQEVEYYTRKLMLYEANPGYGRNDYLGKALFFESCDTHHSEKGDFHGMCFISREDSKGCRDACSSIYDIIFIQDMAHQTKYQGQLDSTSLKIENGPTGADIVYWIGQTGFSSWHGHGTPYGVICSDYGHVLYSEDSRYGEIPYSNTSKYKNTNNSGLASLKNRDFPAVAYSVSCDNAPIDELTLYIENANDTILRYSKPNLGEMFTTRGDYGGPAAIMYSRASTGLVSSELEQLFLEAIKDNPKIGIAHNMSKQNAINWYFEHNREAANLIGEPEFEMWLGKPKTFDINITEDNGGFYLSGTDLDSVRLVLSNNNRAYRNYSVGNVNSGFYHSGLVGGEYCVSVWRTGYLPIVRLLAQNGTLTDGEHRYSVRDAVLGYSSASVSTDAGYTVSGNGSLYVRAVDGVQLNKGFEIDRGGTVTIKCGRTAYLNGGKVKAGGKLRVEAHDVQFGPGFVVEPGGTIDIQIKK